MPLALAAFDSVALDMAINRLSRHARKPLFAESVRDLLRAPFQSELLLNALDPLRDKPSRGLPVELAVFGQALGLLGAGYSPPPVFRRISRQTVLLSKPSLLAIWTWFNPASRYALIERRTSSVTRRYDIGAPLLSGRNRRTSFSVGSPLLFQPLTIVRVALRKVFSGLTNNHIVHTGAQAIANVKMPQLHTLNVKYNQIGDEGACVIAKKIYELLISSKK